MSKQSSTKRFFKVLLLNILGFGLLILLVEVAFALNSNTRSQKEFYFKDRAEKYRYEQQNILGPWQEPIEVAMPYFGYGIDRPEKSKEPGSDKLGDSDRINNYKFRSPVDYPYIKKSDEVVIGVFGGSFAFNWVIYETRTGEFAKTLPEKIPGLKNKKIVLLNLSQSGFKQPQQFFVFAYFYEMLDAAIMIDGLNEISLMTPSGFPLEFPIFSARFYSMARSEFREDLAARSRNLRSVLASLAAAQFNHSWLTKSYLYYFLDSSLSGYLKSKIVENNQILNSSPHIDSFYEKDFSLEEKLSRSADIWAKYTALTHDLAVKNKIKLFHYLQPNQYLGEKPLSEFELKNSYDEKNKANVVRGYSLLMTRADDLKQKKYKISADLMKAFADETADLYIDDCCHVNDSGNRILTQKLLNLLTTEWR